MLDKNTKILIVGLGLLGGSYAIKLKREGYYVSAIDTDRDTIGYARKLRLVDYATSEIEEDLIKNADLIIFALYPHIFIDWMKRYGEYINPDAIVTDVTGVKGIITDTVQDILGDGAEFIPAHPMAGKEHLGIENSDPEIFKDANYIVVPTDKNTERGIEICKELGVTLGFARISTLSTAEHDKMIAFVSQLTHCIAVSLMCATDNEHLVDYTGDSFRDLTRIADINDEMWSGLFLDNREELLNEMDKYRDSFDRIYECIKNNDRESLREMMKLSSKRRRRFNIKKG